MTPFIRLSNILSPISRSWLSFVNIPKALMAYTIPDCFFTNESSSEGSTFTPKPYPLSPKKYSFLPLC